MRMRCLSLHYRQYAYNPPPTDGSQRFIQQNQPLTHAQSAPTRRRLGQNDRLQMPPPPTPNNVRPFISPQLQPQRIQLPSNNGQVHGQGKSHANGIGMPPSISGNPPGHLQSRPAHVRSSAGVVGLPQQLGQAPRRFVPPGTAGQVNTIPQTPSAGSRRFMPQTPSTSTGRFVPTGFR